MKTRKTIAYVILALALASFFAALYINITKPFTLYTSVRGEVFSGDTICLARNYTDQRKVSEWLIPYFYIHGVEEKSLSGDPDCNGGVQTVEYTAFPAELYILSLSLFVLFFVIKPRKAASNNKS